MSLIGVERARVRLPYKRITYSFASPNPWWGRGNYSCSPCDYNLQKISPHPSPALVGWIFAPDSRQTHPIRNSFGVGEKKAVNRNTRGRVNMQMHSNTYIPIGRISPVYRTQCRPAPHTPAPATSAAAITVVTPLLSATPYADIMHPNGALCPNEIQMLYAGTRTQRIRKRARHNVYR